MSSQIYQNQNWRPLHIRDTFLFERGNVKGFATQGGETGTSSVIGPNSNPGAFPDVPFVIGVYSCFGEAAQPGNIRSVDVEQLFNFQGTTTITSNGNIAAIRGNQSIAAGCTIPNGFLYGVQGKLTIQGTYGVTPSQGAVAAGLVGQVNTSAGTYTGTDVLSAIWGDYVGGAASSNASLLRLTNSSNELIDAPIVVLANAQFLMDLQDLDFGGANWALTAAVGGSQTTKLKIKVNGTTFYIPLYTA